MTMYDRKPFSRLRRPLFELCESRFCLSTVAFAAHDIECCAAEDAEFVLAADVDGDGDLDVLSASRMNNKIAWYENLDGQGTFGLQRGISIQVGAFSSIFVTAADLDGDGDLDVLSASGYRIAWHENVDGQGGFGPQRVITSDAAGPNLVAADLDGDGDVDLLSASSVGNQIAWYENVDGQGGFGPRQVISSELSGVRSLAAGDVDGDGDLDVLSASGDQIAWYENTDGKGTIGTQRVITTEAKFANWVAAADFDGDGDMDVASASRDEIAWYENMDGRGTFAPARVISTEVRGAQFIVAADVDRDDDLDVLSASSVDGKIAWYENTDGRGTFGPQQVITTRTGHARSVAAADLDGDGDLDVLSASYGDHKVAWYENTDGKGSFGPQRVITTQAIGASSVAAADFDGDGDLDVLSASGFYAPLGHKIAWYENIDSRGKLGSQQVISTGVVGAISVTAADVDGDGDLDALSASVADGKIAWYENTDGLGKFGAQQVIALANGANSVAAADLDGDGDLDVLFGSSSIAWNKNTDSRGTFGLQQVITTDGAGSVAAADLDGDGDLDVVSASSDKVAWYENTDGKGTFGAQQVITSEAKVARSVAVADVDGDGDLDVLSASSSDRKLAWYENTDGLGNFGPQQVITTQVNDARSVAAADLDGDGDLDVLSASQTDGKLAWYENTDGKGTFGPQQVFHIEPDSRGTRFVTTAHVDGDGDLDVLFASFNRIAWFEQRLLGDANDDGVFDSSDLVRVFQAGEYEDRIVGNSTFDEGDWNGDGEFDSADLVLAFQAGHFEKGGQPSLKDLAGAVDRLVAHDGRDRIDRAFVA